MTPARIAELLQPFFTPPDISRTECHASPPQREGGEPAFLSVAQLQNISTYIDILLRWNARINLTAIRDPEQIVRRHFGESLFAARHLFPRQTNVGGARGSTTRPELAEGSPAVVPLLSTGERNREGNGFRPADSTLGDGWTLASETGSGTLVDIGSGAGFPGIPIKLWAPHLRLTLIESNHKKATFLREVVRALTLGNVDIRTDRAESLVSAAFDVATLRAVERFDSILAVAAGLVAPGGRLVLLIGASQLARARTALRTFNWSEVIPVPDSSSRLLLVGRSSLP